jgi:hypothetical protein
MEASANTPLHQPEITDDAALEVRSGPISVSL